LLFEEQLNIKIVDKVKQKYGEGFKDYGGLSYNTLFQNGKTTRIDVFNGNYSLFRGLSISLMLLMILCFYLFGWKIGLISAVPLVLSIMRMVRFAKHYATETFKTIYNFAE